MTGQEAAIGDPVATAEISPTSPDHDGLLPPRARLVALAFLMLFSELALIRWLGAHVFYLSYFSNFVLLGSFLGIGLGFLWAGRSGRSIFPLAPVLLGALVSYVYVFDVPLDVEMEDVIFFQSIKPSSALPREVVLALLFVSVAAAMAAIGDGIARTFSRFRPLDAYKWDLVGSVLGIAAFTVLSFLGAEPVVWGLIIAVVFAATVPLRQPRRLALAGAGCALLLAPMVAASLDTTLSTQERGFVPDAADKRLVWSPYYRITAIDGPSGTSTLVNQTPHWHQFDTRDNPLYEGIYDLVAEPEGGDVLVIGAGSGNDVAAALNRDADHVDAVEIDPRLMEIAQDNHPEAPYDDPRVDIHVDDGRAYLERADQKWDRILLGLPDSLTLVPGQSSVRLESYLFTREAMESARDHLEPGGVFAMYNWYRQDWLIDRYAATLASVFDQPPCLLRMGEDLAILAASEDPAALDCSTGVSWQAADHPGAEPVSDDHPFPYLESRSIPGLYLWSALLVLVLSLGAVAAITLVGRPNPGAALREVSGYADLFFMGVAFLLLETKSVVQFALLFGTTWLVNALVFLGVLGSVLIAVAVSSRVTFRRPVRLYGVLLAALALAYVIPPDRLLDLDVVPRFLAAVTLAFFPIFTANLVFTQRFKDTGHSTVAFGVNLVGAMVGGLLEYAALLTGYRNLLVVVAFAYGMAFLCGRDRLSASEPAADQVAVEPEPPIGEPVTV